MQHVAESTRESKSPPVFRQLQLEYHWVSYASLMLETVWIETFSPEAYRTKYLGENQGHQGGESPFPNVCWLMVLHHHIKWRLPFKFQVMLLKEIRTLLVQTIYIYII